MQWEQREINPESIYKVVTILTFVVLYKIW